MPPGELQFSRLVAPGHWHCAEFISDLHLTEQDPESFALWERYLRSSSADAVFILGDLVDVWVGDDSALTQSFEAQCVAVLRDAAKRHALFVMHGNRDFLIGKTFAQATGVSLLHDPTLLSFCDTNWLLTHGDALCVDDHDYMNFRGTVRTSQWQSSFLAQPLEQRRAQAKALRVASAEHQRNRLHTGTAPYGDINLALAAQWLDETGASVLIHGHTHQPTSQALASGTRREVLSDWDGKATPPRAQVLRLSGDGCQRIDLA